ncbi:MAG: hypothetical protein ABH840_02515 [Nanoarchaeota archaeon]
MEFSDEEKIKATLFYHLRRKKKIGESHTPFDTLKRGFPSHLGKDVTKIAEDLIKKGYIISKPTNYGLQVSLNKGKLQEVEDLIKRVLGYDF